MFSSQTVESQHERMQPSGAPAHPHDNQVLQDLRHHRVPPISLGELEALRQVEADGGGHRGDRENDAARTVEAGERNFIRISAEAGNEAGA